MYPHERSLVKKHADKPFAIVGVNSDRDRAKVQRVVKDKNLTWRSFFNNGTSGPIARKWNVYGWPTIYVIDHRGVIRFKNVRDKALDKVVDLLLAEAEGKGEASKPGK